MWTNETIFSKGDLSESLDSEKYREFIVKEYADDYRARREHVKLMIERLQAEYTMLDDWFKEGTC
jgi:hypothetical protein